MAQAGKNPVVLGRVSGLYGVKGWVKIHSYTDPRESILRYSNWMICRDAGWQSVQVAEGKTRTRIEENGKPLAGLVSADELEFLTRFGELRERFQPLLESWAAFEGEDPEQIDEEARRAVQSVRRKYPVSHST